MCERKGKLTKYLEDQRLIQYLMGLNNAYAQERSTILMMNNLPAINSAYSLLLHDEIQREAYVTASFSPDPTSFIETGQ